MGEYLGLDLGGTLIKYALMNENGEIIEKGNVPSPMSGIEDVMEAVKKAAEPFEGRFEGVAVSMPGRIDTANGIAHTGGAFMFIHDMPFAQLISEALGKPCTIANDGKCAAKAELENGALSDVDSGAVVVIGTGIGGGIVLDHKVWMGSTFAGGEFSLLVADMDLLTSGPLDFMGGGIRALWAGRASTGVLLGTYKAMKQGKVEGELNGITFFEAYDAGDEMAHAALEMIGKNAAAGIYSVQSVLDLQRFAIGGGISARPEVTEVIRRELDQIFENVMFTPFSKPEIVTCVHHNDANLIGALGFYLDQNK